MQVVYRHPLPDISKPLIVPCTSGAKVVLVGLQNTKLNVWIADDRHPDANRINRVFAIFGTGDPIPYGSEHCGSFMNGPFVWHLFKLPVSIKA